MLRGAIVGSVLVTFASASLVAASAKDDVQAGLKKLTESGYSWKQTSENAGGGGGPGGFSQEGKIQADGLTWISMTRGDNTTQILLKGDKAAIKSGDNDWQSLADAQQDQQGPGRFLVRMVQNFKAPAVQAQSALEAVGEFQKSDDALSGELSEEAVKQMLTFGGRGGRGPRNGGAGANPPPAPPQISNAKGTAKVWLKDGAVTKIEYHVQGTITRGDGQARDIDRTTTTEFTDIGKTKIEVPAAAKEKAELS